MKYIILVGDGMADEPQEALSGKTPLQVAYTPNMDFLASHGWLGLIRTIPQGFPPGSDVANLSIFGYSPESYYTGRAPLEAASLGVDLDEEDIAFRCNLVSLENCSGVEVMADYSGGGIPTEEAKSIIAELGRHFAGGGLDIYAGVSYRHIFVFRKARKRFLGLKTTPPHDISGRPVMEHLPQGAGAESLKYVMDRAKNIIHEFFHSNPEQYAKGKANAIWLWGEGFTPRMPKIPERYGIIGVTISAVDLIRGIGRLSGLETIKVPGATGDLDTNYEGKAHAALNALEHHDLALVHVEAPDEASHRGILKEKIQAIELFDRFTVGTVREGIRQLGDCRILVLPDHPTPLRTRTHSPDPVPFALYDSTHEDMQKLKPTGFDEDSARRTGNFVREGWRIIDHMILGSPPDFSIIDMKR